MENIESLEKQQHAGSRVHGKTGDGQSFNGWITHFTGDSIVFEVCAPLQVLRVTEVIPEFHASIEGKSVYSGRAVIRGFVDEGVSQRCAASIQSGWNGGLSLNDVGQLSGLEEDCRSFLKHWSDSCQILPEFKLLIADMRMLLQQFRLWLDKLELGLAGIPATDRAKAERHLVTQLATSFIPTFNHLFEKFEIIAAAIPSERTRFHHAYVKQQLHPLLLCSPFAWRTFTKPLGYAGDYEMVNMILNDALAGETLFARVLNAWFISQPPAEAHRNRINVLTETIEKEALRASRSGRMMKVLNLGCGPAIEIQRLIERSPLCEAIDFTLLDFNDETIAYTRQILDDRRQVGHRRLSINFIKKSVMQLLKGGERGGLGENYDFIYCAGLYDYLPDRVCRQLNSIYYGLLAPDGLLMTTNVDACNPIRHMLDYVLEWHLIYRNAGQFRPLAPAEAPAEAVKIYADITGVNIFMEVRRPQND